MLDIWLNIYENYEWVQIIRINIIEGEFWGTVPRDIPQKLITGEEVSFLQIVGNLSVIGLFYDFIHHFFDWIQPISMIFLPI